MSKITNSNIIDARIQQLRSLVSERNSVDWLDLLAASIDAYRAEVAKEIEGLKSDVRSAEVAYEHQGLRLNEIQRQRDEWKNDHDRVAKEKHQIENALKSMTLAKDEWRADSCATEAKLEKAIEERDAYKLQRDGAEIALGKIAKLAAHPDDVVDASFDLGAPEGDKTVVSWKCTCGTQHKFEPPRSSYWSYSSECSTCGSKISLSPLSV